MEFHRVPPTGVPPTAQKAKATPSAPKAKATPSARKAKARRFRCTCDMEYHSELERDVSFKIY